jgi:uncharacterized damage-inducible protein DinB
LTARIPWTERKFDSRVPSGLHPELIERLRGTAARLEELVKDVPVVAATLRDGSHWSIQENAGHLSDLEELWLGRLDDYFNGLAILRPADMTNRRTTEANHNARSMQDVLAAFRLSRLAIITRLESSDASFFARSALHPRLKTPMRVADFLFFIAEHDDYHLARISEILRASR